MLEALFTYRAVLRRHQEAPLATERAAYLQGLADRGVTRETLLHAARYSLGFARELRRWPSEHRISHEELEEISTAWAARQVREGRARSPRWPLQQFRLVAVQFLKSMDRLIQPCGPLPGCYDDKVEEFVADLRDNRSLSPATCSGYRWQVQEFVSYLARTGILLETLKADQIDAYFQEQSRKWGRVTLRTAGQSLRSWLRYCEAKGWVGEKLAEAVLTPRIYRDENLPLGPTWAEVKEVIGGLQKSDPLSLRDRAILCLLAVYGLRSGEVRRLRLDDIAWRQSTIRVVRSKSGLATTLPLEATVGNAIARYLRDGRPQAEGCRMLFLAADEPYRPLSAGALYTIVRRHFTRANVVTRKGHGPHGLRHSCARNLLESGFSMKEVGDHLGHRSPDSTRIYAKVNLALLRLVALEDLGGLA